MKLITEICIDPEVECKSYRFRRTNRAILFNEQGQIALLHETIPGFYFFPGGGIDDGECPIEGLKRECLEEVGANIQIGEPVGMIIEQMKTDARIRISYCYAAKVDGDLVQSTLTEKEVRNGVVIEWHSIDNAIKLFESLKPKKLYKDWMSACLLSENNQLAKFRAYHSSNIRELAFLHEYQKSLLGKP